MEFESHTGHTGGESVSPNNPGLPEAAPVLQPVVVGADSAPTQHLSSSPSAATWQTHEAKSWAVGGGSTVPAELAAATPTAPVPVVRVLSPIGVEYVFLTISLFAAALGLTWALLALVNGQFSFEVLSFPAALLLVSVPVFALVFLHLKKMELRQPSLKLDPSKRRSTQFTQIVSFMTSMFTLVGVVFSIFAKLGGQSSVSVVKILLDGLVLLVVFGGMLAYYWRDEHRN
jgi:hypothetical protein